MENKLIRVALYIRVSTDRQAKEGDSLEAQEDALVKYAKENNYIIVDKYIDGGESGQKLNRTNLTRLLNDVKENKIDLIIMTKLDRWFRSVSDFYKVIDILNKYKVKWKTIWEDYDTTTASGEFWLNMSLSLGRMEAKRTGERIDAVFEHKFKVQKTVCSGAVPYGYKISNEKKIVIDENRAEHIKLLFDYYIKTNCLGKTVRWFQENIVKKSYGSIRLYLVNTAYIGIYKRHKDKKVIEDFCPRILSDEVFYKVQDLLRKNIKEKKHSNTKPYIFNGLLKCDDCGGNLTGMYSWKDEFHYYRCKKAYESVFCMNKRCTSEKKIEKYLLENICNELNKKAIEYNNIKSKTIEHKDTTIQIKKKLEKLVELYTNDLIDIEHYKREYEVLNKKLIKTNIEKDSLKVENNIIKIKKLLDTKFLSIYSSFNNIEKRKFWLDVFSIINVSGLYIDKNNNFILK